MRWWVFLLSSFCLCICSTHPLGRCLSPCKEKKMVKIIFKSKSVCLIGWLKSKGLAIPSASEDMEQPKFSSMANGSADSNNHFGKMSHNITTAKRASTPWPSPSFPGYIPIKVYIYVHQVHTQNHYRLLAITLLITQNWENTSVHQW